MAKKKIKIKKENKGKFTAWAKKKGMSVEDAAIHVMINKDKYSPEVVKMANFAKNAAEWNKQYGGIIPNNLGLPQFQSGGSISGDSNTDDPRLAKFYDVLKKRGLLDEGTTLSSFRKLPKSRLQEYAKSYKAAIGAIDPDSVEGKTISRTKYIVGKDKEPTVTEKVKELEKPKFISYSEAFAKADKEGKSEFNWINPKTGKTEKHAVKHTDLITLEDKKKKEDLDARKEYIAKQERARQTIANLEKDQHTIGEPYYITYGGDKAFDFFRTNPYYPVGDAGSVLDSNINLPVGSTAQKLLHNISPKQWDSPEESKRKREFALANLKRITEQPYEDVKYHNYYQKEFDILSDSIPNASQVYPEFKPRTATQYHLSDLKSAAKNVWNQIIDPKVPEGFWDFPSMGSSYSTGSFKHGGYIPSNLGLPQYQSGGEYTVKSGNTLYGIARDNNISVDDLRKLNPKYAKTNDLDIGDVLNLNPISDSIEPVEVEGKIYSPTIAKDKGWSKVYKNLKDNYGDKIRAAEIKYNLPENSFLALIAGESKGDPKAKSKTGALGLAQFTEGAAKDYGLLGEGFDYRTDPDKSIDAGAKYFGDLLHGKYSTDWGGTSDEKLKRAYESYNWGLGAVKHHYKGTDPKYAVMRKETKEYSPKLFQHLYNLSGKSPEKVMFNYDVNNAIKKGGYEVGITDYDKSDVSSSRIEYKHGGAIQDVLTTPEQQAQGAQGRDLSQGALQFNMGEGTHNFTMNRPDLQPMDMASYRDGKMVDYYPNVQPGSGNYRLRGDTVVEGLPGSLGLPQFQDGSMLLTQPTRQDSLDLLKNTQQLQDYYRGYKVTPGSQKLTDKYWLDFLDLDRKHIEKDINLGRKPIHTPTGKRVISMDEYYQPINPYKFKQRETLNWILDTRAPMSLYDTRIKPNYVVGIENQNPGDVMEGDNVGINVYDPLQITPYDMLTPEQKELRKQGLLKTPMSDILGGGKPGVKPKPVFDPKVSITDYLNREGKPSSFTDRKKLAKEYGLDDYKGTPAQNTELLKLVTAGPPAPATDSPVISPEFATHIADVQIQATIDANPEKYKDPKEVEKLIELFSRDSPDKVTPIKEELEKIYIHSGKRERKGKETEFLQAKEVEKEKAEMYGRKPGDIIKEEKTITLTPEEAMAKYPHLYEKKEYGGLLKSNLGLPQYQDGSPFNPFGIYGQMPSFGAVQTPGLTQGANQQVGLNTGNVGFNTPVKSDIGLGASTTTLGKEISNQGSQLSFKDKLGQTGTQLGLQAIQTMGMALPSLFSDEPSKQIQEHSEYYKEDTGQMKTADRLGKASGVLGALSGATAKIPVVGQIASAVLGLGAGVTGAMSNRKAATAYDMVGINNPVDARGVSIGKDGMRLNLPNFNLGGDMQYNAPPHSEGGQDIDANGYPTDDPSMAVANIEKEEMKVKIPGTNKDYIISDDEELMDYVSPEFKEKYGIA